MKMSLPLAACVAALALLPLPVHAQKKGKEPVDTYKIDEFYNVSRADLGATALGTNSAFNKDWPAQNLLIEARRTGSIFNPFEGATIDIRLVIPMDIEAVDIKGLDYRGTKLPSSVDIYIEGKKVASGELPDDPAAVTRIVAKGQGQNIRLVTTGSHPRRPKPDGTPGPDYGGLQWVRVLSTTDLRAKMQAPPEYQVAPVADSIAPTMPPKGTVDVFVDVRQTEGHPNTLWDKQDIAAYQEMMKKSPQLKEQYEGLKRAMDERMQRDLGIPEPKKDEAGNWTHLKESDVGKIHNQNALDIANAATVYALSGDEKYGEFAKKMLLGYADVFDKYAPGNRPGFTHDSGILFDQRLSDSTWLIQVARGYDLIYNLDSINEEERDLIQTNLLRTSAEFIAKNSSVLRAPTNWSAICTTAVLITGYAIDDPAMVELAMYGPKGTAEKPTGGVMLHFGERSIGPDGMWSEGAMGYQGMAMQALVMNAEILRHHGIDMYSHRDAAFKSLFDSPLEFSYPDLTAPAIHDSGRTSIVGRESYLWEYGYLRYRDPKYLTILKQAGKHLDAQFQQFPVSVLYDESILPKEAEAVEWKSVNLFDVGYGILRNTTDNGTISLLMDYGPNRSHGHPDKLNIDLYAFGDQLIPDPGMVWYEQPLYKNWYRTTLAHNTLVVDELDQMDTDGQHLVYGFGDTLGMQRGNADKAYAGVIIDRAVFLTPHYMADIFGAFAPLPRKLDLAWHIRGEFSSTLDTKEYTFPEPRRPGYSELTNTRSAEPTGSYTASFKTEGGTARFHAANSEKTEVLLGDGILGRERPTTLLQRRITDNTIYANVVELDYDGAPFVKSITRSGSLQEGYGAMTIETVDGLDYGFAAYRPGTHQAGPLKTDALQAFVRSKGKAPTDLFLGGGTVLECNGASIRRETPGLAYVEATPNGGFVVGNPSPSAGKVTVQVAGLDGLQAFALGKNDARTGEKINSSKNGAAMVVELGANARVEFAKADAQSLHDFRAAMLRKVREEQEAAMRAEQEAFAARDKARAEDAKKFDVPAGTKVVVQAEDFTAQGGGEVVVADNKMAAVGTSLSRWNDDGHWLEYTVTAPEEGYYHFSMVYCSQYANVERNLEVNGENQEEFVKFILPATGGWANGSDDWRLVTLSNSVDEKPLLIKLKAGENKLKMMNLDGKGANLDYVLVTSPDVTPERLEPSKSAAAAP